MKNKLKTKYRLKNWSVYNESLKRRGNILFWLSPEVLIQWHENGKAGEKGAPQRYSDLAIELMLTIAALFHLPLRQSEGFGCFLMEALALNLKVPDYTTLCRRRQSLPTNLKRPLPHIDGPIHLVVDSTGIKVYGEGEWLVKIHGPSKRRRWLKLHLALDSDTGEILCASATPGRVHDGQMLAPMLSMLEDEPITQVSADGSYDQRKCYEAIAQLEAYACIPPRKGAKIWQHGNRHDEPLDRDENLRHIRVHGRKNWKIDSSYHRRSVAESAMSRFKRWFGPGLKSHHPHAQGVDLAIRCSILNQAMTFGIPDYYPVQS